MHGSPREGVVVLRDQWAYTDVSEGDTVFVLGGFFTDASTGRNLCVIGSGMGGLACGALSQEYGSKVAVLESHIKPGGSAHTFSRMHNGGKYSFEVGPSIFEGLDKPSLNPLRILLDARADGAEPSRSYSPGAAAYLRAGLARTTPLTRR